MKRILITGKDSYIGSSFRRYMEQYPDEYQIEELDMLDESWREHDFSLYDVIYHVAGIAHIKETQSNESLYYEVNRDLAIEVAKRAKESGIRQFVFMSSMSVYGLIYSKEVITLDTECHPNTYYGISKYEAEGILKEMNDDSFRVCIVRPPMVYGDNSPGNLTKLFKAVRKFHMFPKIRNERSSISIENLIRSIKEYIDKDAQGTYLPQNENYMCTYEIVKEKMKQENINVIYTSLFNPILYLLIGKVGLITKCFGDLRYEK